MTGAVYDCTSATIDTLRVSATDYPFSTVLVNKEGSPGHDAGMKTCIDNTLGVDGEIKDTFFDGLSTSGVSLEFYSAGVLAGCRNGDAGHFYDGFTVHGNPVQS